LSPDRSSITKFLLHFFSGLLAFVLLVLLLTKGEATMQRLLLAASLSGVLLTAGCSPAFWGGAAAGVLGTGAGYEIQSKRQMDRLDEDLRDERISRGEYETRKQQIERGSIIY
jgi:hypothetical protein